ncbi:MAG TPA: substrate-binding domain-containing protein [Terracidiphilus sp.]|jgi:ribose transport system substrate-binding protein|nr:substrate-binding domain-containing protein [Terracidiphilus sp.]
MKTMKAAALTLAVVGLMLVSGCKRHSTKEVYYLISVNTAVPYWKTAAAGFNKAAAQYGVTARVVGPENYDAQGELTELNNAVAAKPSGILISVADASVLQPGIDAAESAGVPVITVDSDAAGSHRLYFIGTNNLEAGRLGGRRLGTALGGRGNVVFYTFEGQPNAEERLKGFKDALSAWPEIKIADVADIKSNPTSAFDKTQKYLAQTGANKIDAFVSLDSTSGPAVADAVSRGNGPKPLVIAWDISQATLTRIKAGAIEATVAQKPFTMGYVGLKALDEVFHYPPAKLDKDYSADSFSPYPVFVDTGTSLVDKHNVDIYIAAAAAEQK